MKNVSAFLIGILSFCVPSQLLGEPLRVGMILPLSGYAAEYGESIKNSLTLLQSELSEDSSRHIEFIYENSEYDGKKAISAFHKITKTKKIDLLYVWGTTPSIVLASLAESAKIPMIAFSGEPEVTEDRKYVLDSINRIEDYSVLLLEHIRSKGHKNIAIVKTEMQYLESLYEGMEGNLKDDETIHLIESFTLDASSDVRASALKIRSGISKGKYDIIGVLLIPGQISSFYQRLAQLNITIPSFGSDLFSDPAEMKKAGPASVDAFYVQASAPPDFSEKFTALFHNSHHASYAYNSYSLFKILYNLFPTGSENLTADQIITRIEENSPKKGSGNDFYFTKDAPSKHQNPGKRFESELVIKTVKGETIRLSENN